MQSLPEPVRGDCLDPGALRGGEIPAAIKAVHRGLSRTSAEFLEFVEQNPECLRRSSFGGLEHRDQFIKYPIQSWPTFVGPAAVAQMQGAATGVLRLLKSIPERIFGNDPARLGRYYGLPRDEAAVLVELGKNVEATQGMLARGDFVRTAAGWQALELNVSANIGGWQTPLWAALYRSVPLLERFCSGLGERIRYRDTVRLLLEHLVCEAQAGGVYDGKLNVAFAVPGRNRSGREVEAFAERELQGVLREKTGADHGRLAFCGYEHLRAESGRLYIGDERIHVLLDHYDEINPEVDRQVFSCLMNGTLKLYNGPLGRILGDKRNFALLSRAAASPAFTPEEQAILRAHVPWTREVKRGYTDYAGQPVRMDALLAARRRDLVLKHARSSQGAAVYLGRGLSVAAWDEAVSEAFAQDGMFIVQEHLESEPFAYQNGAEGWCPHDVIWGLFVFGETYGGAFLRMMPRGAGRAINSAQGASVGAVFEVDEVAGEGQV